MWGLAEMLQFCMHAACMFAMDAYLPLLCSLGSWRLQRPGRLGRVLDFCWALACFQRLWPRWAEGTPALPHSGGHACSTYSGSFGLVLDAARCFLLSLCATKTWVASWRQMVSRTALASEHATEIITRKHEKAKPLRYLQRRLNSELFRNQDCLENISSAASTLAIPSPPYLPNSFIKQFTQSGAKWGLNSFKVLPGFQATVEYFGYAMHGFRKHRCRCHRCHRCFRISHSPWPCANWPSHGAFWNFSRRHH